MQGAAKRLPSKFPLRDEVPGMSYNQHICRLQRMLRDLSLEPKTPDRRCLRGSVLVHAGAMEDES